MKRLAMEHYTGAFICTTVFLLLTAFDVPRAVAADAVTDDTVAERISAAKTAADHEALANYFRAAASTKAESVARHEAMFNSWRYVQGKPKEHMRAHCQTLLSTYAAQQKALVALAAEHEKLAKAESPGH